MTPETNNIPMAHTKTVVISMCVCIFLISLIVTIITISIFLSRSLSTPTTTETSKTPAKWTELSGVQLQLLHQNLTWEVNYESDNYEDQVHENATADAMERRQIVFDSALSAIKKSESGEKIYNYKFETESLLRQRTASGTRIHIPNQFDARAHWPGCPQISRVYDQAGCGSCWAVATASAITDRICISTNSTFQQYLSADELVFCCPACGQCHGGSLYKAFAYWKIYGLVREECMPYTFPPTCGSPCKKEMWERSTEEVISVHKEWEKECPVLTCGDDKYYAKRIYALDSNNDNLKLELMERGPFITSFRVYEDFLYYKSGIYSYTAGQYVYRHVVKVIGWGQDNETNLNYWIISNSWGKNWGENGFGRIAMIEESNKDTVSRTVNLMEKPVAGIVQDRILITI